MSKYYCPYCMESISIGTGSCVHCGRAFPYEAPVHHMKPGTLLRNKYLIGRALGEGGFGITYIGRDLTLDMLVAVKEYFPGSYSHRNHHFANHVTLTQNNHGHDFEKDMQNFLNEARALAKFHTEPGIVGVRDYFRENGTAYIVMEYLEGVTLKKYLQNQGKIPAEQLFEMMEPVLVSLEKIHSAGLIHRDISPDNLVLMKDGRLKLLDFGAAREMGSEKSLSVMLKRGYAPEEQYRTRGNQGPWTDVYAICATMYKCLTGITPLESLERVHHDKLQPPSRLGVSIKRTQEAVLMQGLSVRSEDRYQNIRTLRAGLQAAGTAPQQPRPKPRSSSEHDVTVTMYASRQDQPGGSSHAHKKAVAQHQQQNNHRRKKSPVVLVLLAVFVLAAALFAAFHFLHIWSDPTCTEAAICRICGKAQGKPLGHSWTDATSDAPMTCSVCGETRGEALPPVTVYLNEMTCSSKNGKLWTRSEDAPAGKVHTPDNAPDCWKDTDIPGHTAGTVRDQAGNTYTYGLHIDGSGSQNYSASYELGGVCSTFSGTCGFPENPINSRSYNCTKYFEIYGDGTLLYTSPVMDAETTSEDFSVSVEGVQVLTILYPATDGTNETATLFDARLERRADAADLESTTGAAYLNTLQWYSKTGKLWTRSADEPDGEFHTPADAPDCWKDTDTPGHTTQPVRDQAGNTYTYGLHIDGSGSQNYSVSYELGGAYATFSGTCGFPENPINSRSYECTKYFEIYGDGTLLYTSPVMDAETASEAFSLSVKGVQVLTILYPATDGTNETATLFDAKLEP